jgi:hypothetical protein
VQRMWPSCAVQGADEEVSCFKRNQGLGQVLTWLIEWCSSRQDDGQGDVI